MDHKKRELETHCERLERRLGWGQTQIRAHLERLRDLEYIALRNGQNGERFEYELLMDCNEESETGHIGLIDVKKLRVRREAIGEK